MSVAKSCRQQLFSSGQLSQLISTQWQVGIAPPPPETPGVPEPAPQDRYARPKALRGLPKEVILYQYEVCPFCNKARAVLDYYKARGSPLAHVLP